MERRAGGCQRRWLDHSRAIVSWNLDELGKWVGAPLTVPYGYAGARRDDAVGLYLMGARWYDPTLGCFIEQDPIGEAGGMNLHANTASSGVMWTDPSGPKPLPNKTNGGMLFADPMACGARCQAAELGRGRRGRGTARLASDMANARGRELDAAMERRKSDRTKADNGVAPGQTDTKTAEQQQSGASTDSLTIWEQEQRCQCSIADRGQITLVNLDDDKSTVTDDLAGQIASSLQARAQQFRATV